MNAEQVFATGVKEYESAVGHARQAKQRAIIAGLYFLKARRLLATSEPEKSTEMSGDIHRTFQWTCDSWKKLLYQFADRINERQVRLCVEFANNALEWARAEHPELTDGADLERVSMEIVMRSPKPFTALLREMKLVRQVGAYDAEKHAEQQRIMRLRGDGGGQLDFHFETFGRETEALINSPRVERLSPASLEILERQLTAALARVRQVRATITVAAAPSPDSTLSIPNTTATPAGELDTAGEASISATSAPDASGEPPAGAFAPDPSAGETPALASETRALPHAHGNGHRPVPSCLSVTAGL